jgi:hypothetical protein
MRSQISARPLTTLAAFAGVTAALTLAVLAPRTTFADGDEADRMGEWTAEGTKFDDLVVSGGILRDAHAKSGWMVTITVANGADHPETVLLETDVDRSFVTPMARVADEQAMLYHETKPVTVAAHASVSITRPVPAWVASQLETGDRIEKARARAQKAVDDGADWTTQAAVLSAPYPHFALAFYRGGDKPVGVPSQGEPKGAPGAAPAAVAEPPAAAASRTEPAPVAAR